MSPRRERPRRGPSPHVAPRCPRSPTGKTTPLPPRPRHDLPPPPPPPPSSPEHVEPPGPAPRTPRGEDPPDTPRSPNATPPCPPRPLPRHRRPTTPCPSTARMLLQGDCQHCPRKPLPSGRERDPGLEDEKGVRSPEKIPVHQLTLEEKRRARLEGRQACSAPGGEQAWRLALICPGDDRRRAVRFLASRVHIRGVGRMGTSRFDDKHEHATNWVSVAA